MRLIICLLAAAFAAVPAASHAQSEYPSRPVRLIVGFAAGGISDVLARALAVPLRPGFTRFPYAAMGKLLRGQAAQALPQLRAAQKDCPQDFAEYEGAAAELKRLGK